MGVLGIAGILVPPSLKVAIHRLIKDAYSAPSDCASSLSVWGPPTDWYLHKNI